MGREKYDEGKENHDFTSPFKPGGGSVMTYVWLLMEVGHWFNDNVSADRSTRITSHVYGLYYLL